MPDNMTAYYNEIDPYAAQWLRNLIAAGHIAAGEVDERSILDVRASDLAGFKQCHFFAGIGAWSYALRLAGWPDDRSVWTGSCPCQPFSAAGSGDGFDDERHLWPFWFRLIEQCRPGVIFGEQVEAAIRHGWLDIVQADMEGIGYAFAAVNIPAAGVGAPHIRQRLWFVADTECRAAERHRYTMGATPGRVQEEAQQWEWIRHDARNGCVPLEMADSDRQRCNGEHALLRDEEAGRLAESIPEIAWRSTSIGRDYIANPAGYILTSPTNGFWRDADWILCRDAKWRPVEPGTFPLAHGTDARMEQLRAYGNAITPQVAAEFVSAYMECQP